MPIDRVEGFALGRSQYNDIHIITIEFTTLNIVFSVTYYLKSRDVITIYHTFYCFVNKGQIGCLDIYKTLRSSLVNKLRQ